MEMSEHNRPIDEAAHIPANLSDEEMIDFLDERGVSEKFLENTPEAPEEERPVPRTRPINVRFDDFTLGRLKGMAQRRNVGYQTLLKTFVTERLYEEEKREGVVSVGRPTEGERAQAAAEPAEPRDTTKPREWQSWAYDFTKENQALLEDPDVDPISLSRLAKNSSSRLLELSGEIKKASAKEDFPATQLRRMTKGYERLKALTEAAIELYEEKFGAEEFEDEDSDDSERDAVKRMLEEAERIRLGG